MTHAAMTSAYDTAKPLLAHYISNHFNNPYDVDDVLQTIFLKAWIKTDSIQETYFLPWCYRVAHNECIDIHRQQKRCSELTLTIKQTYVHTVNIDVATEIANKDLINTLPQRFQDPALLYYIHGYSTQDIARILHRPASTIRGQIFWAKKILAQSVRLS